MTARIFFPSQFHQFGFCSKPSSRRDKSATAAAACAAGVGWDSSREGNVSGGRMAASSSDDEGFEDERASTVKTKTERQKI